MSLRTASLFAIVGTALWTLRLAFVLITALNGVSGGFLAANVLFTSLIEFFAALTMLIFFVVFHRHSS